MLELLRILSYRAIILRDDFCLRNGVRNFLDFLSFAFMKNFTVKNKKTVKSPLVKYIEIDLFQKVSPHHLEDPICTNKLEEYIYIRKKINSRTFSFSRECETADLGAIFFVTILILHFFFKCYYLMVTQYLEHALKFF